jgi:hypothetical protein
MGIETVAWKGLADLYISGIEEVAASPGVAQFEELKSKINAMQRKIDNASLTWRPTILIFILSRTSPSQSTQLSMEMDGWSVTKGHNP